MKQTQTKEEFEELVVSTLFYSMGKMLGAERAAHVLHRMIAADPAVAHLPQPEAVTSIVELQKAAPTAAVNVCIDAMSTHLGRARSRHAQFALDRLSENPGVSAWVSLDDDMLVESPTLRKALALALESPKPRVVVVPALIRQASQSSSTLAVVGKRYDQVGPLNFTQHATPYTVHIAGTTGVRVQHAGFGLVVVNQAALREMRTRCEESGCMWLDNDGMQKVAPFREPSFDDRRNNQWLGEDYQFFANANEWGWECLALCEGESCHDGRWLDLKRGLSWGRPS